MCITHYVTWEYSDAEFNCVSAALLLYSSTCLVVDHILACLAWLRPVRGPKYTNAPSTFLRLPSFGMRNRRCLIAEKGFLKFEPQWQVRPHVPLAAHSTTDRRVDDSVPRCFFLTFQCLLDASIEINCTSFGTGQEEHTFLVGRPLAGHPLLRSTPSTPHIVVSMAGPQVSLPITDHIVHRFVRRADEL